MQLFSVRKVFSFFPPLNIFFSGTNDLHLAKRLFNGRTGRQTESGKVLFSESETGKCLTDRNGLMWHNFQAGKHVHFLVFAFMWVGGVVSIFHMYHLGKTEPSYWYRPVSVPRLGCFSVVLKYNESHDLCFLLTSSILSRIQISFDNCFLCLKKGVKR